MARIYAGLLLSTKPVTLHALLVGIDEYRPPVRPLRGCVADVDAFSTFLRARHTADVEVRTLLDHDATRAGFIDALRQHLGAAGPGDVALLYYSGHGGEEPVPAELSHLESGDRLQTLVLADTGQPAPSGRAAATGGDARVVRPLADKELAVLIEEVADRAGHLAVILDCCHSGDADRDVGSAVRAWEADPARADDDWREIVGELSRPRPLAEFLDGTLAGWTRPARRHVALSACRAGEKAKEHAADGVTRGAFSLALEQALIALGPNTTYRGLLNTVRSRVERSARGQRPVLAPLDAGGPGDGLFLDGAVTPAPPAFTMTRRVDGWRIDGGLVHGLHAPDGDAAFVLACVGRDGALAGAVRVTRVDVGTAAVEPLGWEPEDVAYTATVVDVPFPPADVEIDPAPPVLAEAAGPIHQALRDAVAGADRRGGPSPDVRLVSAAESHPGRIRLRVDVPRPDVIRILLPGGEPVSSDIVVGTRATPDLPSAARTTVARLGHVVRWERIRGLGGHPSPLADSVALELFPADPDERSRPPDRPVLPATGGYRLTYTERGDGGWRPPYVFADLVNRRDAPVYVAVLDLTDQYRCDVLFETEQLAPGKRRALLGGQSLSVTLPEGRPIRPGASARDWLLVIVSDVEFSAYAFELPALDEPTRAAAGTVVRNALERIAARAMSRDVAPADERPPVARWSASTITLEVTVPDGRAGQRQCIQ